MIHGPRELAAMHRLIRHEFRDQLAPSGISHGHPYAPTYISVATIAAGGILPEFPKPSLLTEVVTVVDTVIPVAAEAVFWLVWAADEALFVAAM